MGRIAMDIIEKEDKKNLDKNYIIVPKDKKSNCKIILNVFK